MSAVTPGESLRFCLEQARLASSLAAPARLAKGGGAMDAPVKERRSPVRSATPTTRATTFHSYQMRPRPDGSRRSQVTVGRRAPDRGGSILESGIKWGKSARREMDNTGAPGKRARWRTLSRPETCRLTGSARHWRRCSRNPRVARETEGCSPIGPDSASALRGTPPQCEHGAAFPAPRSMGCRRFRLCGRGAARLSARAKRASR